MMMIRFFHLAAVFVLSLSIWSLSLTRLGIFSGWAAAVIALSTVLLAWRFTKVFKILEEDATCNNPEQLAILALVFGLVAFLQSFCFPFYNIDGSSDEGNYVIQSVQISRHGELNLDLPVLRNSEIQTLRGALWDQGGFPGIYSARNRGWTEDSARLIPQFSHLTSATRAVLTSVIGIKGVWVTSSVFAAAGIVSFLLLAVRFLGLVLGGIATFALLINAAFVWHTRTSMTEPYTLFAVSYGTLVAIVALQRNSRAVGFVGGFVLGLVVFSRADGTLIAFFVLALVFVAQLEESPFRGPILVMLSVFTVLYTAALIDLVTSSKPYAVDLVNLGRADLLFLGTSFAIGLSWLAVGARPLMPAIWIRHLRRVMSGALWFGSGIVSFSFVYFYYFGPLRANPAVHHPGTLLQLRATTEIEWYITLPVFALYFVGLLISCRQIRKEIFPLLVFSGITLFTFMLKTGVSPVHPYASRRWLAYVIPLVILLSLIPVRHLIRKRQQYLATVLVLVVFGIYVGAQSRLLYPWFFESQLAHWPEQYERLAGELRSLGREYFLTDNKRVGSVLTYVYDVDVLFLAPDWEEKLPPSQVLVPVRTTVRMCGRRLFQTVAKRPTRMDDWCVDPQFYVLETRAYTLGDTVDFSEKGNASRYKLSGWSRAEPWGSWTEEEEAKLLFSLETALTSDLQLTLEAHAFVHQDGGGQRVGVTANGQLLGEWRFVGPAEDEVKKIVIPQEIAAAGSELSIELSLPEAVSPSKLGVSGDSRLLGLGVARLRLAPIQ